MRTPGPYDGSVQMFIEEPRDADVRHLGFLRWLAERGAPNDDGGDPLIAVAGEDPARPPRPAE